MHHLQPRTGAMWRAAALFALAAGTTHVHALSGAYSPSSSLHGSIARLATLRVEASRVADAPAGRPGWLAQRQCRARCAHGCVAELQPPPARIAGASLDRVLSKMAEASLRSYKWGSTKTILTVFILDDGASQLRVSSGGCHRPIAAAAAPGAGPTVPAATVSEPWAAGSDPAASTAPH